MGSDERNLTTGSLICDKYKICEPIGKGGFGICYAGEDLTTGEKVAIKLDSKTGNSKSSVLHEITIYRDYLKPINSCIPAIYWYGSQTQLGNVIVMQLLGPNLEKLFQLCDKKFSQKTIQMIAFQMIEIMKTIHSMGLIHRDIKPENFLLGSGIHSKRLFIIDFGLSKPYKDNQTGQHIDFNTTARMTGTLRYCSINANKGHEQSRRDDMESLAYIMAYLHLGSLPWQGIKVRQTISRQKAVQEIKETTPMKHLFKNASNVFVDFLFECKHLDFKEEPNYEIWRTRFGQLIDEFDYKYDWDRFGHNFD
ncbi:casein kinase I-like [Oppia nitens]|uniref:casein kinase I-like n=1 Tax=Oppia nitens TaxID=1686743 RepID=UPI0023DAC703|nr:casein kinase I-like [Oppia nitens]